MLGFSGLMNVKKSAEMNLVLKGIGKNSRKKSLISPSLWFNSKFTGEPVNDEGTVDPVPEGVEARRRQLADTSTTETSNTTTTTGSTTTSTVEAVPVYKESDFGTMFTKSSSAQFRDAGYVDAMIPNLSFTVVTIFLGGFWYFTSSVFCGGKITVRSNWLMRFLVYGGERCIWVSLMLSTLELTLFSVNNLLHPDFSSIGNIVSFSSSVLAFLFVVSFPVIIFKIANKGYDILWSPDYYNRYAFFFCEFKLDSKVNFNFLFFFFS